MECEDTKWYDPSHSSCSGGIPGLFIELAAVTFGGNNHPVARDSDGTDYDVPHWLSWKDEACIEDAFCCFNWWDELCGEDVYDGHEHPVAYTRNDTVEIEEVRFLISGNLEDPHLMVLVPGSEGVVVPLSPDGHYLVATDFDLLELGDAIAHYDPLEIEWRVFITIDDENHDVHIATSENTMYVTLADPQTSPLYHTVVDIACQRAHGLDDNHANHPQHIFDAIWDGFKTLNITRAEPDENDGTNKPLHYYQSWETVFEAGSTQVPYLLEHYDGQCGSWARLFRQSLMVHNVHTGAEFIWASSTLSSGASFFLVKNWSFTDPGTHAGTSFPYLAVPNYQTFGAQMFNGNAHDWMNNALSTPEAQDSDGIYGQGGTNPLNLFSNHQFARIGSTCYDPSYGVNYTGAADMQTTAIDGFSIWTSGLHPSTGAPYMVWRHRETPTAATYIYFTVEPW